MTKVIVNGAEVTEHKDIVAGFKKEGIKSGRQTETTPLMTEPLLSDFGYLANNHHADKVLAGTYQPPMGTDEYAIKLLPHLKKPEKVGTIKRERLVEKNMVKRGK